jgi:hypothetical protein
MVTKILKFEFVFGNWGFQLLDLSFIRMNDNVEVVETIHRNERQIRIKKKKTKSNQEPKMTRTARPLDIEIYSVRVLFSTLVLERSSKAHWKSQSFKSSKESFTNKNSF